MLASITWLSLPKRQGQNKDALERILEAKEAKERKETGRIHFRLRVSRTFERNGPIRINRLSNLPPDPQSFECDLGTKAKGS